MGANMTVPTGTRVPAKAIARLYVSVDSGTVYSTILDLQTQFRSDGDMYTLAENVVTSVCGDVTPGWTNKAAAEAYEGPGRGAVRLKVEMSAEPDSRVEAFEVEIDTAGSFCRAVTNATYVVKDDAHAWIRSHKQRAESEQRRRPRQY